MRNLPFISICPFSYLSALVLINVSLKHAARPIQLSLQGFVWLLSPKSEINLQQCTCVDYLRLLCNQHLWSTSIMMSMSHPDCHGGNWGMGVVGLWRPLFHMHNLTNCKGLATKQEVLTDLKSVSLCTFLSSFFKLLITYLEYIIRQHILLMTKNVKRLTQK